MINNDSQFIKPRVFVSSKVEGFEEFRESARQAIKSVNGEPVLVNEDFPAKISSSRNTCLDGIDSADIFILVIGDRGGWTTPSGKFVIEEEYLYAKKKSLPVLVFLQRIERDKKTNELIKKLSDYVDGNYHKKFDDENDLKKQIDDALKSLIVKFKLNIMDKNKIESFFKDPDIVNNESYIRFVLAPEREEKLIDPVKFGSDIFKRQICKVGHDENVKLFNYELKTDSKLDSESLNIIHYDSEYGRDTTEVVRLKLLESGIIIIDSNVTGLVKGEQNAMSYNMIILNDIELALKSCFSFAKGFYDTFDEYKRHLRFYNNVALINLNNRRLIKQFKEQTSYEINMFNNNDPIMAFNDLTVISRVDLVSSEKKIEEIIALFLRRSNSSQEPN